MQVDWKFEIETNEDDEFVSAELICYIGGEKLSQFSCTFDFWENLAEACKNPESYYKYRDVISDGCEISAYVCKDSVWFSMDSYSYGNGGCMNMFVPIETYLKLWEIHKQ